MDEYVTAVEGLGFRTFVDGKHLHVSRSLLQVAVMRVSELGDFEWGWVEHLDGNGRSVFWEWAQWWRELRKATA